MARYTDITELTEHMRCRYAELAEKYGDYDNYVLGYGDAFECVEELPTADVVPRAEDETTLKYCKDTVKSEVAREILEEIEAVLAVHTLSGKSEDYSDGALDTLQWVDAKLAELKKKYTEGASEDGYHL